MRQGLIGWTVASLFLLVGAHAEAATPPLVPVAEHPKPTHHRGTTYRQGNRLVFVPDADPSRALLVTGDAGGGHAKWTSVTRALRKAGVVREADGVTGTPAVLREGKTRAHLSSAHPGHSGGAIEIGPGSATMSTPIFGPSQAYLDRQPDVLHSFQRGNLYRLRGGTLLFRPWGRGRTPLLIEANGHATPVSPQVAEAMRSAHDAPPIQAKLNGRASDTAYWLEFGGRSRIVIPPSGLTGKPAP